MIAYLDMPSGISGDMFLGCLLDAGWSVERLRAVVGELKLNESEWAVGARSVMKGVLRATLADVEAKEGTTHRHFADIEKMIGGSGLPAAVKQQATAVFWRLAQAEGKVHGTSPEKIHFHEVGAVDAIIDIVGVVAGLRELGIEKLYASAVPLGSGWARTEHGQIPLPAPATLELLSAVKAPTKAAAGPGEWVTPTGAALIAELATFGQPAMTLEKIGIGAGRKETAWPNVARLWLGQAASGGGGELVQLETNIDDMNPQLYGAVSEKLFAAGAKDVWLTPIQMKKNRPAVLLSALGTVENEGAMSQVILQETTTLGVRVHSLSHRHEAQRDVRQVDTAYGPIRVKVKYVDGTPSGATPEFDDCKAIAEKTGVALRLVLDTAGAAAQGLLAVLRTGPAGMTNDK